MMISARFLVGEGVAARFFSIGERLLVDWRPQVLADDRLPRDRSYNDEGDYVLNRVRLYRDRRDFIIQPGDVGKPEDYPVNPPHRH